VRNQIAIGLSVVILAIGVLSLYRGWGRVHSILIGIGLWLFVVGRWIAERPQQSGARLIDYVSSAFCVAGVILFVARLVPT
jgi:hypothetical protein